MKLLKKSKRKNMRRFYKQCHSGNCENCPFAYKFDSNHCRLSDACKVDKNYAKYKLSQKYGRFYNYDKVSEVKARLTLEFLIFFGILCISYATIYKCFIRPLVESYFNNLVAFLVNVLLSLIIGFSLGKILCNREKRVVKYWKDAHYIRPKLNESEES